jgi:steroid 5-alpha reductase family enzyme
MAADSSIKQIFWVLYMAKEQLEPKTAIAVGTYNGLVNTAMSLALITAASTAVLAKPLIRIPGTAHPVSLPIAVGTVLYAAGLLGETVAEFQRKRFKDDPANKGKVCTTGLWAWVRHPNHGAYTIWRVGYALAAGSWAAAALVAAWHARVFTGQKHPGAGRIHEGAVRRAVERVQKGCAVQTLPRYLLGRQKV